MKVLIDCRKKVRRNEGLLLCSSLLGSCSGTLRLRSGINGVDFHAVLELGAYAFNGNAVANLKTGGDNEVLTVGDFHNGDGLAYDFVAVVDKINEPTILHLEGCLLRNHECVGFVDGD